MICFAKCHVGLSLGDKEGTQLHTFLSVYEQNNRSVTDPGRGSMFGH